MAKGMSQMFLGKQIEGVWHTSIVVYGTEYFFGGGLCTSEPKVKLKNKLENTIWFAC